MSSPAPHVRSPRREAQRRPLGITLAGNDLRTAGGLREATARIAAYRDAVEIIDASNCQLDARAVASIVAAIGGADGAVRHVPLRRLLLSRNSIGFHGVHEIAALAMNVSLSLEEIDLRDSNIGHAGVVELGHMLPRCNLKRLDLSHNDIGADGAVSLARGILASRADMPLMDLLLSATSLGDNGVVVIAAALAGVVVPSSTCAVTLAPSSSSKVEEAATQLPPSPPRRLRKLDLCSVGMGVEGTRALALAFGGGATSGASVGRLNVSGNIAIGDSGAGVWGAALAAAADDEHGVLRIAALDLSDCAIGPAGAVALAAALCSPGSTQSITEDGGRSPRARRDPLRELRLRMMPRISGEYRVALLAAAHVSRPGLMMLLDRIGGSPSIQSRAGTAMTTLTSALSLSVSLMRGNGGIDTGVLPRRVVRALLYNSGLVPESNALDSALNGGPQSVVASGAVLDSTLRTVLADVRNAKRAVEVAASAWRTQATWGAIFDSVVSCTIDTAATTTLVGTSSSTDDVAPQLPTGLRLLPLDDNNKARRRAGGDARQARRDPQSNQSNPIGVGTMSMASRIFKPQFRLQLRHAPRSNPAKLRSLAEMANIRNFSAEADSITPQPLLPSSNSGLQDTGSTTKMIRQALHRASSFVHSVDGVGATSVEVPVPHVVQGVDSTINGFSSTTEANVPTTVRSIIDTVQAPMWQPIGTTWRNLPSVLTAEQLALVEELASVSGATVDSSELVGELVQYMLQQQVKPSLIQSLSIDASHGGNGTATPTTTVFSRELPPTFASYVDDNAQQPAGELTTITSAARKVNVRSDERVARSVADVLIATHPAFKRRTLASPHRFAERRRTLLHKTCAAAGRGVADHQSAYSEPTNMTSHHASNSPQAQSLPICASSPMQKVTTANCQPRHLPNVISDGHAAAAPVAMLVPQFTPQHTRTRHGQLVLATPPRSTAPCEMNQSTGDAVAAATELPCVTVAPSALSHEVSNDFASTCQPGSVPQLSLEMLAESFSCDGTDTGADVCGFTLRDTLTVPKTVDVNVAPHVTPRRHRGNVCPSTTTPSIRSAPVSAKSAGYVLRVVPLSGDAPLFGGAHRAWPTPVRAGLRGSSTLLTAMSPRELLARARHGAAPCKTLIPDTTSHHASAKRYPAPLPDCTRVGKPEVIDALPVVRIDFNGSTAGTPQETRSITVSNVAWGPSMHLREQPTDCTYLRQCTFLANFHDDHAGQRLFHESRICYAAFAAILLFIS